MKDLTVGETIRTPGRTVGEADVSLFAGLVGDFTPIHVDETFAAETLHGGRIAHGPLTMSMAIGMSTLAGLFGERVIALVNLNWDFMGAVKSGDTIRSEVTVEAVRPSSKPGRAVATYGYKVFNQTDALVQSGRMIVIVRAD